MKNIRLCVAFKKKLIAGFSAVFMTAALLAGGVPAAAATHSSVQVCSQDVQALVKNGSDLQLAMALKGNKKQWKRYKRSIQRKGNEYAAITVSKKVKKKKAKIIFLTTVKQVLTPEEAASFKSSMRDYLAPSMKAVRKQMPRIKKYARLKKLTITYKYVDQAGTVLYSKALKK